MTATTPWTPHPAIAWLIREGWHTDSRRLMFEQLATRLHGSGVPLWRMALYIPTLHPELYADAYFWRRDTGETIYLQAPHTLTDEDEYRNSPLHEVTRTGKALRRHVTGPQALLDYPLLIDLAAQGATDHYIVPIRFSRELAVHMSFTSDAAEGFRDQDLVVFDDLALVMAPIAETFATRIVAERLLDTYVGRNAGQRVLAGQIGRGSGETIRAAILFADLRGFTELSERMPRERLIGLLNSYFDCVTGEIETSGGEVLKFIGDAVLAIFPVTEATSQEDACASALRAARAAVEAMRVSNLKRGEDGEMPLGFGIALHMGEVMYGNIGAARRLDFTVIGPAVNYVTRLERICRETGRSLVLSADVAATMPEQTRKLGVFTLRSVPEPQAVFVPVD